MLEVLDKSVWDTVAEQRIAHLGRSMGAARRAVPLRRRMATVLAALSRRLDRGDDRRVAASERASAHP